MLTTITIGCTLAIITTVIHASAMMVALSGFRRFGSAHWVKRSGLTRAIAVTSLVLVMLLASVVESGAWAITYLLIGALDSAEEAVYFSMVTYTTLGYGDITLSDQWRLLSSFEAANGILMFGWSTALIFAAVHSAYLQRPSSTDGSLSPLQ